MWNIIAKIWLAAPAGEARRFRGAVFGGMEWGADELKATAVAANAKARSSFPAFVILTVQSSDLVHKIASCWGYCH